MLDYMCILTRILFISCCLVTAHCAQPNCTSVTDFDDCKGNITDFCPENIVCACKDEKPFCKCPNFRGQWGNYWYMGAKCEQLWNTLDLILVAALPGIGLALIVGVTIQTIHYCKKKSKKNTNYQREQRSLSGLQLQQNSAYALNTAKRTSQPDQGQMAVNNHYIVDNPGLDRKQLLCKNSKAENQEIPWSSSLQAAVPKSPVSPPPQFSGRNYNFMTHEPKEENPYIHSSHNWDSSLGRAKPEGNYENKYSSTMHMKPLFNFSTSGISNSSYTERQRQQLGYPNSEEPDIPYKIGRVQMKLNY